MPIGSPLSSDWNRWWCVLTRARVDHAAACVQLLLARQWRERADGLLAPVRADADVRADMARLRPGKAGQDGRRIVRISRLMWNRRAGP